MIRINLLSEARPQRKKKGVSALGGAGRLNTLLMGGAIGLAIPIVVTYFETGLVPRLPSAVLAVGLELSGMLTISVGLVLHTTVRRFQEFEYQLRTVGKGVMGANWRR